MDRPEPSESETKTILIRRPLQRQFVEDVSSETAVLVEYWRLRGAIVGSLRDLLGPFEGLLEPSWAVMSSSPPSGPLKPSRGPLGAFTDRHESLQERIEDDLDSESPPKSIGGACLNETVVLVEYRRLHGAILGPLRGLLCPAGGLLEPSWTVVRPSESEFKAIFIWSPL